MPSYIFSSDKEPELHNNLIALNMIRDLTIHDGTVSFTIMLTTPACPLRSVMEKDSVHAALGDRRAIDNRRSIPGPPHRTR